MLKRANSLGFMFTAQMYNRQYTEEKDDDAQSKHTYFTCTC